MLAFPDIVAAGVGFTVNNLVVVHPMLLVNVIVAVPAVTPVTRPVVETVAIAVLEETQGFVPRPDSLAESVVLCPAHTELDPVIVGFGFMLIVPFFTATVQEFPVVVTVYGNDPITVGVPLIVSVVPEMDEVTPTGKPETVAPVAPPPNVILILVIAVFVQTVRFAAAVMV